MPGKSRQKQAVPANGHNLTVVETRSVPKVSRVKLSAVEQTLLGAVPGDRTATAPLDSLTLTPSPRQQRLESVRSFLAAQPELRAALAEEVEQTWKRCGEDREAFLAAFAARRAEIVSRAELSRAQPQARQAVDDFQSELARYLLEIEGLGFDSSVA